MRVQGEPEVVTGVHKRATFLMGIPTLGMVPIEFMLAFGRMQFPVNCSAQTMIVKQMEVGVARNYIAEQLLKMNPRPEYLLFMGDDMIPPWDSLMKLHEAMVKNEYDVLSGLYYMKAPGDYPIPVMWNTAVKGTLKNGEHFNVGEIIPVDVTGMDFCIIRSDVFDKIGPAPWFKTSDSSDTADKDGANICIFTEDVYFCRKVKEAGLKIGVHTGIRCGHLMAGGEVY